MQSTIVTNKYNLFVHKTHKIKQNGLALTFKGKHFNLIWLLFFCIPVNCKTSATEIKLKRENIYVWMQNKWFDTKMWCYKLMFRKYGQPCPVTYELKYFTLNNPDVQDPSWGCKKYLFGYIYKVLDTKHTVLLGSRWTCANVSMFLSQNKWK